ncbi:dTDP-glucose 4,6-dehydratase [Desulfovibrio subterraneus]|jgi:dTDP-glucose 4,6-dehydratase|uniref:dTDP-glucose 4,6-dehydratase n=1 Tax=Desulfovibrio subterraneus TaxID=2718620 RepID=A0A7J0BKU9_9BACT|nr:dTDP-glucose 4,6-dehydratase [Desulfovibrio subterraneus]GFM34306.1 dTDP-glucose 4,6-dehydratase [Desulfovibrio subterraneus]
MRLLVTGGCGFIGSNYIQYLFRNDDSVVVVNLDKLTYAGNPLNLKNIEDQHGGTRYFFEKADIADPVEVRRIIEEHGIEAVVNFAAETHVDRSINDPAPFVTTNVLGTQNLLTTARALGIERFVHVSTDEVYGDLGPADPRFTEQTPLKPSSPYSASKAAADMLAYAFYRTYGYPVCITRCSNNYGPYQFPEKLIPLMFKLASSNSPLPVYGDGSNIRDWIHVDDHCHGVHLTLLKGIPGKAYNFGGNAERTNMEVVRAILSLLGKPESLISYVKDRPGHDRRYAMDYSLAQKELGYEPAYTFERGIAETIAWYQANGEWLESVESGAYREFMQKWYGDR